MTGIKMSMNRVRRSERRGEDKVATHSRVRPSDRSNKHNVDHVNNVPITSALKVSDLV